MLDDSSTGRAARRRCKALRALWDVLRSYGAPPGGYDRGYDLEAAAPGSALGRDDLHAPARDDYAKP
ncbi:MAG TPA: hypothetical protein VFB58_07540 [Chloroflexota bacterium]|nr:hypothetical protein [Chloroflexota bacterium]